MQIYINLDKNFEINQFTSQLPEINIFSDIYIYINDLKYLNLIFNVLEEIIIYLNTYTFSCIHLHLIHPYKEDLELFYLKIYQSLIPFNLEGYRHQVIPRLIIFPIFLFILPQKMKSFLESHFFIPGIILDKKRKKINIKRDTIERVFINSHATPLISIGYQNILLNLLDNMQYSKKDWYICPDMMIFERDQIFPCIYAYENKLTQINKDLCNKCLYNLIKKISSFNLINIKELANLHFRLGLDLFEKRNIKMASKHFQKVLKLVSSEEKKDIYFYLGICKAQLGKYNLAIKYLKNTDILNHNTYFYLGFSFYKKNDYFRAKKNFEKALNFDLPLEEKIVITLYLGHTYKALERYEETINLCKEISKEITNEQIFNLMGTCYFKLKAYEEAANCFKKAISLNPFSAIDYANLCLSLKELNRKEEAKYYGEKALKLDPNLEFVKRALKEIEF